VCTLRVESLIADQGKPEIKYLLEKYAQLFEHLDLPFQLDRQRSRIIAEGYGLRELLTGEVGIHLFYVAHRNPLPVRIQMKEQAASDSYSVIRIYDGTKTLTDIRTSFTNAVNMTPQEFKLLLYAGLPDERRATILKTS
jgi:ATP-dependent Clp protease ATP-binding subunit ClpC